MASSVCIVGAGATGAACARICGLRSAESTSPISSVTVLERTSELAQGTPFRRHPIRCDDGFAAGDDIPGIQLGALMASFNISQSRASQWIDRIRSRASSDGFGNGSPLLQHFDDGLLSTGLLSRAAERPQGWNRAFGQWEHYRLNYGNRSVRDSRDLAGESAVGGGGVGCGGMHAVLTAMLADAAAGAVPTRLRCGSGVRALRVLTRDGGVGGGRGRRCWLLTLEDGSTVESDVVVLALPAPAIKLLLHAEQPLSSTGMSCAFSASPAVEAALSRCTAGYLAREAVAFRFDTALAFSDKTGLLAGSSAMGGGPLQPRDLFLQRLLGKFSSLCCSETARISYDDNRVDKATTSSTADSGTGTGGVVSGECFFYQAVDRCVSEADVSDVGNKTVHTLSLMERKAVQPQSTYTYILVAHFAPYAAYPDGTVRPTAEGGARAQLLAELAAVLAVWTNLQWEGVLQVLTAAPRSEPQSVQQAAVFEPAPLSPLRESGCVLACEDPPLLLSGDWATGSGTVSGAILSGESAAEMLLRLLSREAQAVGPPGLP